jgi:hypothetical protein
MREFGIKEEGGPKVEDKSSQTVATFDLWGAP